MPPGHSLKRGDFCILVTKDELDSQSQTGKKFAMSFKYHLGRAK